MAYGAPASSDDVSVSNAGPYTYHWKRSDGPEGRYTIDVAERDGGDSVATIAVYRVGAEPGMEFEADLLSQSHGTKAAAKMECELTRRYVAREVASVIRYAHREKLAITRLKNREIVDVKVSFDDWWGETPLDDSAAWAIADEGVFERGGCWPRLGGINKENPSSSGVIEMASNKASSLVGTMREMTIGKKGYTPLGDGGNRNDFSFGMIGRAVYTNGGLVAKVEHTGTSVSGYLLSKKGSPIIASFEYSAPKPSKSSSRTELYTNVSRFKLEDRFHDDHTRAYAMLAFTSLIQSLHGKTRLVALGLDTHEDLGIKQWVPEIAEKAPSGKRSSVSRMR
ncbi:MAG: hypothetical protein EBZ77_00485 [Chitinophagia bacterium]|nr:hypothetical protein [Chitinophagia bacterium]